MDEIIEQAVSWEEIGDHDKSEYRYSFGTAGFSKTKMALNISMELNFIIPYANLDAIKAEVRKLIPAIKHVSFSFTYCDVILSESEIIKGYLPYLIHDKDPGIPGIATAILRDIFKIENEELIFYAMGIYAVDKLNGAVAPLFERKLSEVFGINKRVRFTIHEERYQSIIEWLRREKETELELIGRTTQAVSGEPVPICLIKPDDGIVIIQGELFGKKEAVTKQGRKIMTLFVSDNTTAIPVKSYMTGEKLRQFNEYYHIGDIVKISGEVKYDKYERCTVLEMSAIERISATRPPAKEADEVERGGNVEQLIIGHQ